MTENREIRIIIVEQVTNQFITNPELDIEQDLGNFGYVNIFFVMIGGGICHFSDLHCIMLRTLDYLILFKVYCLLVLQL